MSISNLGTTGAITPQHHFRRAQDEADELLARELVDGAV